jgi:hypothetical protein
MDDPRALETLESFDWLKGQRCTRVYRRADLGFVFEFGHYRLAVLCAWRISGSSGELLLGRADYEQLFANRSPVDAAEIVATLMIQAQVLSIATVRATGDLVLAFTGGHVLETWSDSASADAWRLSGPGGRTWTAAPGALKLVDLSASA